MCGSVYLKYFLGKQWTFWLKEKLEKRCASAVLAGDLGSGIISAQDPLVPSKDFLIWYTLISGVINFGSKLNLAKTCQLAAQNVHWSKVLCSIPRPHNAKPALGPNSTSCSYFRIVLQLALREKRVPKWCPWGTIATNGTLFSLSVYAFLLLCRVFWDPRRIYRRILLYRGIGSWFIWENNY